jgi:hypothetical protein
MHVPCDSDNIAWVTASLAKTSARIRVFDVADAERAEDEEPRVGATAGGAIVVDWNLRE